MQDIIRKPLDFDFIFLSYRESCADKNFLDLKKKVPHAKRVHGVKGFSAAHKKAASIANTEWFFTVDADSIIYEDWIKNSTVKVPSFDGCVCWKAYNPILFSSYGNGGLKLWNKKFLEELRSHEDVDEKNKHLKIDFCYDNRYIHINQLAGETDPFHSSQASFSSGFREGLKLIKDARFDTKNDVHSLPKENKAAWIKWTNLTLLLDRRFSSWGSFGARFSTLNLLTIKNYKETFINQIDDLYSLQEKLEKEFGKPFSKKWLEYYEYMGKCIENITGIRMCTIIRDSRSSSFLEDFLNFYKKEGIIDV
ncbi:MAG: hypothetical protein NZZ41_00095 [Candidatus Dojkabacteria bacterium]|nr:hypothetical protein [Candidatus Dojkabacteria bacterium]